MARLRRLDENLGPVGTILAIVTGLGAIVSALENGGVAAILRGALLLAGVATIAGGLWYGIVGDIVRARTRGEAVGGIAGVLVGVALLALLYGVFSDPEVFADQIQAAGVGNVVRVFGVIGILAVGALVVARWWSRLGGEPEEGETEPPAPGPERG